MTPPPPPFELPDDPADEFQGDMHAPDIVCPTGEEMPLATHAEVHKEPERHALAARPSGPERRL
jgi:hypothetical protein